MKVPINVGLLFLILIISSSCDYYSQLEVVNETNRSIIVEAFEDSIANNTDNIAHYEYYLTLVIPPNTSKQLHKVGKNGWLFALKRSYNQRLNLYIFDQDSLLKYSSLDSLLSKRLYDLHSFDEETITRQDWRVIIK